MSRFCAICGKGPLTGNTVSHAKNRAKRVWLPNLISVKTIKNGTTKTIKICARCLKSNRVTKKV
ncbi:MAG: 50S ribosomal protein L28 [Treponema sp.]|nr:50S ribosomal protein L28 [Treponema sp.]